MKSNRTSSSPSSVPARLVASLAIALAVASSSAQAQTSYTSTSNATAWNAARWNNSSNAAPYGSTYTANNNVSFTSGNYTFAGMGAAVNVGNVTLSDNVKVTFTAGGTFATNGAVRTFSLGSGSTFDLNATQISTTVGTGFIISGSGVFATGTYTSTTNNQSFTINSGTVIARGTTGLGNGANSVLNLNGGTVASNASRVFDNTRFGGGISVGGNVQFGELSTVVSLADSAASLSFANNVSLGNFARTFTLGNNGTQTFSGNITGTNSAGLTFAANSGTSAGRFDITGTANTFSGGITITGGEARFTADGSLGAANKTITIDGGRFASASNTSMTIASTRAIAVGDTVGTSISATGNSTITYNGTIADVSGKTGAWAKQGAGTLALGGVSTYTGATAITGGTLRLTTGNDRLPTGTVVSLGDASSTSLGTLDLNGLNQQIAGLASTAGSATTGNNTVTSTTAATLTISGNDSYAYGNGTAANSGLITGAITLVKSGSGTQTLGGNNTYSGNTTISAGTLSLSGAGTFGSGSLTVSGGTANLGGKSITNTLGALTGGGAVNNGTLTNNSSTYNVQSGSIGAILAGSNGLSKSTDGSVTLSGANTYSGNTTISAGTLALGSSGTFGNSTVITVGPDGTSGTVLDLTAKSAFSFGGAQTVKGNGTINIGSGKTVTIAGILAPGNSIGANTITGDLTLTGKLQSELGTSNATASSGISDRTAVSGNLTLTGSTLQLINNAGANSQGSAGAGAYRLATYGGTLTGTFNTITNPLSSTLHEVVSYGSGNVDLTLYRLATATAPTSSINLGNVRVGGTLTGNASITNSASSDGFSEQLKANVTGSGTGFTGVAGGSSGTVNYSVATSTAGVQSGSASVVLQSTGVGAYGNTTLSTTAVSLSGAAYSPAAAAASQTIDIKTRVDVAGTSVVSLTNTGAASATYQETLGTTGFTGITSGFTATGSATGIAGGSSGNGTLSVGGTFATSGVYTGSATLGLRTEEVNSSGLGNLAITGQTVNINVTAYDLASPNFTKTGGEGSFSGLTLDFGTVAIGATYTATINLANASGDYRDSLGGTYTYTGSDSISSTAADFSSLAAGASNTFTISFNAATAGTYTGTLRFSGLSQQTGLDNVGLSARDIEISITAIPEPSAYAALAGFGMIGFALYRRRSQNASKRAA